MVVGQNTLHRMKCIRDGSVSSEPRWVALHSRPMSRPTCPYQCMVNYLGHRGESKNREEESVIEHHFLGLELTTELFA